MVDLNYICVNYLAGKSVFFFKYCNKQSPEKNKTKQMFSQKK